MQVKELFVAYKSTGVKIDGRIMYTPEAAIDIAKDLIGQDYKENFLAFFLNAKNKIMGFQRFVGDITGAPVFPAEIMRTALLAQAAALILAHNHPSGDALPSLCDKAITIKIKEGAKLFDIELLDHVIIGEDAVYSFRKDGIL